MTDKNLEQMRQDIDKIDSQITDLFRTRMETSLEIAKYKKEHQIPVLNDNREKEVLHKVSEQICQTAVQHYFRCQQIMSKQLSGKKIRPG